MEESADKEEQEENSTKKATIEDRFFVDYSVYHPLSSDFQKVIKNSKSTFPFKYMIFKGNYSETVNEVIKARGFAKVSASQEVTFENIHFIWKPTQFKKDFLEKIDNTNRVRSGKEHLVVNHLENCKVITTKTGLVRTLKKFYQKNDFAREAGYDIFDTTPSTFLVTPTLLDPEYIALVQRFKELESGRYRNESIPGKHCRENVWLVKPAAMNQGKGIEIFRNNLEEMKKYLFSKSSSSIWVIQKYIERPLLYKGRKFDIRMWALVTWNKELYFYPHGYVRTSSDEYTLDSKLNYVHLTNNCLQKFGEKYGAFETGNTIGFPEFSQYLLSKYSQYGVTFDDLIINRVKDVMIDTFLAAKKDLNPRNRRNCFELLGFDFLLDEDLRAWLLEVNINPYLGLPNEYIRGLLPKMLNDLFEIVLDVNIPPANEMPIHEIPNQFELLD